MEGVADRREGISAIFGIRDGRLMRRILADSGEGGKLVARIGLDSEGESFKVLG
jgi:hypothetical protein